MLPLLLLLCRVSSLCTVLLLVGYDITKLLKKMNYPDDFFLLLSVEKVLWSIISGFGELLRAPGGGTKQGALFSTVRVLKVFSAKRSVYFLLFRFSSIENSASSKYETNTIQYVLLGKNNSL
jgi:hypothetical protein